MRPEHLVLVQGAIGLGAAFMLLAGSDDLAAVLLLVRTTLDNADGQLARVRGQATQLGRYLDTEVDFFTNVGLFVALGLRAGALFEALIALALLTLLLSADYVLNSAGQLPPSRGSEPWATWLEAFYRSVFGPQDAFFRRVFFFGDPPPWLRQLLANLGLSSQHTALALLAFLGWSPAYVGLVIAEAVFVFALYLGHIWRIRFPRSRRW